MFPNHMGPPDGQFNPYYNNGNMPTHHQFNHTPYNPAGYGRPTPHHPQGMNNMPPPLGPSWNVSHQFPPPPPPPTHQAPQSSTNFTTSIHHQNSTFPFNTNNTNQRNQFQHPGGPNHPPCPPPPGTVHFQVPPNPYGHHHPSSQYMMPPMFQGGDMLHHQSCTMPGGPQSEMFYNNNLADQQLRHMQNMHMIVPPGNPSRPPRHHNSHYQREKPQHETGIPVNVPWRFDRPDALPYPHKGNLDPGAREVNQGLYNQWTPAPSPQYEFSPHPMESTSRPQPNARSTTPSRWTPAKNVLEQNTAPCFDESSEELAEIFADKPSKVQNWGSRGSETCSNRSSVRTTSSGYVFYSDDDGLDIIPSADEEFGSKKVFSESTMDHGCTQDALNSQEKQTWLKDKANNNQSSQGTKPSSGLPSATQQEQPPADQLQKVGNYLKGLLKVDVTYCHGNTHSKSVAGQERRAGRKSKSPNDGPTIRSLIDQPIYNNCKSRLMNKKNEENKEKAVSIPSRTIKRINIQKITSHFRVLFEPIPDMFAE